MTNRPTQQLAAWFGASAQRPPNTADTQRDNESPGTPGACCLPEPQKERPAEAGQDGRPLVLATRGMILDPANPSNPQAQRRLKPLRILKFMKSTKFKRRQSA